MKDQKHLLTVPLSSEKGNTNSLQDNTKHGPAKTCNTTNENINSDFKIQFSKHTCPLQMKQFPAKHVKLLTEGYILQ